MLLGLIFSIFTATYTLNSTISVEPSGTLPAASTYFYERSATTGQKGQMTAGNATRLELKGWDGCTIHSVTLEMHSNAKSGRGSLTAKVGNDTIWAIYNQPFSEEVWAGQYTTEWVTITKDVKHLVETDDIIEIIISASENSLYIKSYSISYEPAEPKLYSVSFKTGLDTCPKTLYQSSVDAAIVLPMWQDTANWHFVGWCEKEIEDNQISATVLPAGSTYIPRKNIILWAAYTNAEANMAIEDYESGQYAIAYHSDFTEAISGSGMAMAGGVSDGAVPVMAVDMVEDEYGVYCMKTHVLENMLYDVEFDDDSTLTITHTNKGPIGYSGAKLQSVQTRWQYRVLEDGSIQMYYPYNNSIYVLYFGYYGDLVSVYSQALNLSKWTYNAFWLFPIMEKEYTSWPLGKDVAVDNIQYPQEDRVYYFGVYELHIRNGQKILYIKH